jgi:hypothetical protein
MTFQDFEPINANHRLMFIIFRMEVRRRVIIKVHTNQNAEKLADCWHLRLPFDI